MESMLLEFFNSVLISSTTVEMEEYWKNNEDEQMVVFTIDLNEHGSHQLLYVIGMVKSYSLLSHL